jgi:hypothetical protein
MIIPSENTSCLGLKLDFRSKNSGEQNGNVYALFNEFPLLVLKFGL